MATLKRIGALSVFKVGLLLYGCLGLVLGAFVTPFSLVGLMAFPVTEAGIRGLIFGTLAIVFLRVLYGVIGGVFGALFAWLYNVTARFVGGVEIDQGEAGVRTSA